MKKNQPKPTLKLPETFNLTFNSRKTEKHHAAYLLLLTGSLLCACATHHQPTQNQASDLPEKALLYKQNCEKMGGRFDVLKSKQPDKYGYYGCMVNGVGRAIKIDY